MTMDRCLKATLNQTIYVAASTGRDSYGDPAFGTKAKRKARVEVDRQIVLNPFSGSEEVTTHRIVVENQVGLHDKIWLPNVDSTDDTLARRPKSVEHGVNEDGSTHHWEVLV